jgi:hypothetical protein
MTCWPRPVLSPRFSSPNLSPNHPLIPEFFYFLLCFFCYFVEIYDLHKFCKTITIPPNETAVGAAVPKPLFHTAVIIENYIRAPAKEFSQISACHVTIHYVFSQHISYSHHYPLQSSIYFFYRFSTANSIHTCNVLFAVECCETITLVFTFKFYL